MGLFHCVSALPPPNHHFLVAPFHRSPKLIPHSHPPFSQNISQNKSQRGSARSGCGRQLLISGARPDDPCGSQPTREGKSSPPPPDNTVPAGRRIHRHALAKADRRLPKSLEQADAASSSSSRTLKRRTHALAPPARFTAELVPSLLQHDLLPTACRVCRL